MAEKIKYYLRLKLRVGMTLAAKGEPLTAEVAGRPVTIHSENRGAPPSTTSWLVIRCRGFETEAQAREFGEHLRLATHLAGLCSGLGVDAGDPGEDRKLSWVNPEAVRRINPDLRVASDVHGVMVLPDDGNTVIPYVEATLSVEASADNFVRYLEECLPGNRPLHIGSPSIRRAIRVLSLAQTYKDPIAKLVLSVSTVEGLAIDPPWTDEQRTLIDRAAEWLEETHGAQGEAMQVVRAIRRVRQESIRQRIRKLLQANDLSNVWQDWDKLYGKRRGLFHGRSKVGSERQGSLLEEFSLRGLGEEAIELCTRIVLSIAQREGIAVPTRANVY